MEIIDKGMTSRLQWTIKSFQFSNQKENHDSLLSSILFTRASVILENSLNILIEKNFPSTLKQCESRPLSVVNFRGDTWGNRARNLMYFIDQSTHFVTYIYSTETGISTDKSSYALPTECLGKINRYECLFLPTSNCTLPTTLTDGNNPPDAKILGLSSMSKILYDKTSAGATLLDISKLSQYKSTIFKHLPEFKMDQNVEKIYSLKYNFEGSGFYIRTGHALAIDSTLSTELLLKPARPNSPRISTVISASYHSNTEGFIKTPSMIKYLFGYVHRYNTELRLRIQSIMNRYQLSSEPPFSPDLNCVMVHIRKDDRTKIGEFDMIKWCKSHLLYNKETMDDWKAVEGTSESDLRNYGCNLILPYGAATLEHFLNASLLLAPHNKNIFITTDDQAWLHQAIHEYRQQPNNLIHQKELQLFPFHPRHNHRKDDSIDAAAEFFSTIELGRQCSLGFVGYTMSSAVAQFFYQSLCYYNRYTYLSCPPLFEFGVNIF